MPKKATAAKSSGKTSAKPQKGKACKKEEEEEKEVKMEEQETTSEATAKETSICSKSDFSKLHSALRYAQKKDDSGPLEAYMKCSTRGEKQDFCKKYLQDRKWGWLHMDETFTTGQRAAKKVKQGWMTRSQIAHEEKLDPSSPLLGSLLQHLPCQEHPNSSWQEAGEKEYFYTVREMLESTEEREKKAHAGRHRYHADKGRRDQTARMNKAEEGGMESVGCKGDRESMGESIER